MQKRTPTLVKFGLLFLIVTTPLNAQDVASIEATSDDISENLDLKAVASVFGDTKDLETFEQKLNDPEAPLSNLDLNEDGYVDYLRVIETMEEDTHVIVLQAVLDENVYQDVATIEVEKDTQGTTHVQVVGNIYVYGTGYIVQPVYVHRPVIFNWLWSSTYRPYRSVYYWGYYPKHYSIWKPFHLTHYKKNVLVHVNVKHTYRRTTVRYSTKAVRLHTKVHRNDYALRYPQRAHAVRVTTVRKTNGTSKRVATVRRTNAPTKRVATSKETNSKRKAVVVSTSSNGTRTVKAAKVQKTPDNKEGTKTKVKKRKVTKKKVVKKKRK